jgi:homopolymeric O-antigen transport system permease protein
MKELEGVNHTEALLPETIIEPKSSWSFVDFKEISQYRDLFLLLVWRDVTVLYKQTILGFAWAIIRPLFSMVVFSVVFGRLTKMPTDGIPYPIFSYAALVPWTYFSTAMTNATQSLIGNANMITKVYFPRLFIPLTPVFSGLIDFAISFLFLGVLMLYYSIFPSSHVLLLPLLLILLVLTVSGIALWLSALAIQYRDVKYAVQFFSQILMYAAPVVWPVSLIPAKFRLLYGCYPMAAVIEGFRSCLLGKTPFPWDLTAAGFAVAILIFITGSFYFRRTERIFADIA